MSFGKHEPNNQCDGIGYTTHKSFLVACWLATQTTQLVVAFCFCYSVDCKVTKIKNANIIKEI